MRWFWFAIMVLISGQALAQNSDHPCRATDLAKSMNILIGDWDIYMNGKKVTQFSAKFEWGNCAILVQETTLDGRVRDLPFYYYDREAQTWRRIFGERRIKEIYLAQYSSKSFALITNAEDANGNPVHIRETYAKLADGSLNHVVEAAESLSGPWYPKKEALLRKVE